MQLGLQNGVVSADEPFGLGLNETLLPQYLKKYGYRTHMVGKVTDRSSIIALVCTKTLCLTAPTCILCHNPVCEAHV